MVSDTRLSSLLNRLGGLYRDPNRVDRDSSSLLKSSVGKHLAPTIASLVENNGDTSNTLCLKGTISIHFRGNEYQQLMDIYLPPGYPVRPPMCFVRLAVPTMYLKENHAHVGSDGQVYLPYLHEWRPHSHSLIELVVAMSSVFSADPPVFTRNTPAPLPPPSRPPPSSSYNAYTPAAAAVFTSSYNNGSSNTNNSAGISIDDDSFGGDNIGQSERDAVAQVQEQIALEESKQEAEALAEKRRTAAKADQQRAAQEEWDAKNFSSTKEKVRRKIYAHLIAQSRTVQQSIQTDMMDQKRLTLSEERLSTQMNILQDTKKHLEEQHLVVDKALLDITTFLKEQKKETKEEEVSVDDMVRPISAVDAQMLQLSVDSASYTDVLYFLDMALHNHAIPLTVHLKEVRNLAKKQFMARAQLLKISQLRIGNNGR